MKTLYFSLSIDLDAPRDRVLAHAGSMDGVNQELAPFMRMTAPAAYRARSIFEATPGPPLFRSWLLAFGVLPVDFDHLAFEDIDPSSGFQEASTMLTMRSWRHERRVTAVDARRSRLVDRLEFVPRIPGSGPLLRAISLRLFRHRHARLAQIFNATT